VGRRVDMGWPVGVTVGVTSEGMSRLSIVAKTSSPVSSTGEERGPFASSQNGIDEGPTEQRKPN
jgi:hypothetical protein